MVFIDRGSFYTGGLSDKIHAMYIYPCTVPNKSYMAFASLQDQMLDY